MLETERKKTKFVDDRKLRREGLGTSDFAVKCTLTSEEGEKFSGSVVNFHFKGACVTFADLPPETAAYTASFTLGDLALFDQLPVRICWTDKKQSNLGLEFLPDSKFTQGIDSATGESLSSIHPTFSCSDPFHVGRVVVGEVVSLGISCILVEVSLSNKYLLPGLELPDCEVYFPRLGICRLDCVIVAADLAKDNNKVFDAVLRIDKADPVYAKYFLQHCLMFNSKKSLSDLGIASIKELPRALSKLLTFRKVNNSVDYYEVLKIRLAAYQGRDKELKDARAVDMGEGLTNEGTILGVYLGGTMVGTVEIRFGAKGDRFRIENYLSRDEIEKHVPLNRAMEVNRLAIQPYLQGTDVLMGIMQRITTIAGSNDGSYLLFSATDDLKKQYLKVGAIDLKLTYPHPYLTHTKLHALVAPREVYSQGKGLNPYFWIRVYDQVNEFLANHGFDNRRTLSIKDRFIGKVLGWLYLFQKSRKLRSKKKAALSTSE